MRPFRLDDPRAIDAGIVAFGWASLFDPAEQTSGQTRHLLETRLRQKLRRPIGACPAETDRHQWPVFGHLVQVARQLGLRNVHAAGPVPAHRASTDWPAAHRTRSVRAAAPRSFWSTSPTRHRACPGWSLRLPPYS